MAFDSLKADLKAVGAAIKNSPKAMRKKLGIDSSAHAQSETTRCARMPFAVK